jgi:uncharacterized membrane protein
MNLLIAGLALWVVGHFFKRIAPAARAGMDARLGPLGGKAVMGVILLAATVMVVKGYRAAPVVDVYVPPTWGINVNNLAMLFAVGLMGAGKSKGRIGSLLRHPMLTGVLVWGLAHLLVNGDVASIVLFGGLSVWAVANMLLINATAGPWDRPEPGPAGGDFKLLAGTVVLFIAIAAVHSYIGPSPLPV